MIIPLKKLYIETYGCQMNVVDSEVVVAILQDHSYEVTENPDEAELVLVNTCSIRDNAEQRVNARIREFAAMKNIRKDLKVGVIGCMAERLKEKLLEKERSVDLVVGPDAYRELPSLLKEVETGQKGINTLLSMEETYGDISPVRLDKNHVSAFVSIMRGCNNHCAYCVVPFVRGRERNRDPVTVLSEVKELFDSGYREVTLLGQNVNSYQWEEINTKLKFESLLARVARVDPALRVRFATSHPKDMSDDLLKTMAGLPNICRSIHLPVQSGSSAVLKRMNRKYTRESYMQRIESIWKYLPGASVSTDIITGYSGETDEEHKETLSLMEWAGFDFAYMFKYSERPGTYAEKRFPDNIPDEVKTNRLQEIIALQNRLSLDSKKKDIGKVFEVLVEGTSKKSDAELSGRTSENKVVVFPGKGHKPGDYVRIKIEDCTSATLIGNVV